MSSYHIYLIKKCTFSQFCLKLNTALGFKEFLLAWSKKLKTMKRERLDSLNETTSLSKLYDV